MTMGNCNALGSEANSGGEEPTAAVEYYTQMCGLQLRCDPELSRIVVKAKSPQSLSGDALVEVRL